MWRIQISIFPVRPDYDEILKVDPLETLKKWIPPTLDTVMTVQTKSSLDKPSCCEVCRDIWICLLISGLCLFTMCPTTVDSMQWPNSKTKARWLWSKLYFNCLKWSQRACVLPAQPAVRNGLFVLENQETWRTSTCTQHDFLSWHIIQETNIN